MYFDQVPGTLVKENSGQVDVLWTIAGWLVVNKRYSYTQS